jgi:hypothetical protein
MKTWLLILLFAGLVLAQEAPSFVEVGGIYRIQGDFTLNTALEEQDYEIEVTDISGNWIKAYVEMLDGEVWFNLDHVGAIVDIRDIDWRVRASQSEQAIACLKELATAQEVYLIDNGVYTDHETLLGGEIRIAACEGIELTTFTAFDIEETYFISGGLGDFLYNVTPKTGITPALPLSQIEPQLRTCLREIATAQEVHFIDYDTYANYFTLRREYGEVDACEGVAISTREATEDTYNIIGRIQDTAFRVTPQAGLEQLD